MEAAARTRQGGAGKWRGWLKRHLLTALPLLSPSLRVSVWQAKDALMAAVLDGLRAGSFVRAVYYDVLDAQQKNLRDCLRRFDGAQPVRTPLLPSLLLGQCL